MPCCAGCGDVFPNRLVIDGKSRNLSKRKYCLDCSPFKELIFKRELHPIWSNEKVLKDAITGSKTIKDVLKKLGKKPYQGNYSTLKGACRKLNITLPVFDRTENAKRTNLMRRKSNSQIFCKSTHRQNGASLKKRMLEIGIENKCRICGLDGVWQGQPLTLQIDHIDGDCCNNLVENLRLLCPNCHAQTETFSGNKLAIVRKCACGKSISRKSNKCRKCAAQEKNKEVINYPPITKLAELFVKFKSFVRVAEQIGCSDNGLRLFLKRNGIMPNEFKKKHGGYSRAVSDD